MKNGDDSAYLRQIRYELLNKLLKSYRGWRLWRKMRRACERKETTIVLIPMGDREISFFALTYLKQMLNARKLKYAVIATNDPLVIKYQTFYKDPIVNVIRLTEEDIENLLQLYCLYRFDENFIVASLDQPTGRNGTGLIGTKGITKEEIFCIGIYGLSSFLKAEQPNYEGCDPELAELLSGHKEINSIP